MRYLIFHAFHVDHDVYTPEVIVDDLNSAIAWIREHLKVPYIGRYFISAIDRPIAVRMVDNKLFLD